MSYIRIKKKDQDFNFIQRTKQTCFNFLVLGEKENGLVSGGMIFFMCLAMFLANNNRLKVSSIDPRIYVFVQRSATICSNNSHHS